MLNRAKRGKASGRQLFDYYLGWLDDQSITPHFEFVPGVEVAFAREWGMRVEIEDLRRVVEAARKRGRRVVMGGHSLGGSITTAYATWDFAGRPGARGLSGLVYIDVRGPAGRRKSLGVENGVVWPAQVPRKPTRHAGRATSPPGG